MADTKRLVDALVRSRRGGLAGGLAALGGLALIAGLGYRALARDGAPAAARRALSAEDVSDDDADLYLRAMVAATLADGMIDTQERARLDAAIDEAGLDAAGRRDLDRLFADPPAVDEIADRVADPDAAARVYAAARLAIDPDTVQERTFLAQLAEALDLDAEVVARVEAEAGA
ncbi:DUF533 domain-containing protein [Methylobacterium isbiliense]|uniref:Inner membrane protein YebE n=1 Tax=Methylobacterium isbiliense TaxID=315478 RepID=A0ABQ4SAL3_9HYPH|nr:DUF533 domain-containing protein [Methylobacterium isbiliense]MDN3626120.1 DUF533 domain-containing protein [Methylobacterium isbiliense]GJE00251.1 hypothetical protein GMJLKIPL_2170 [Methylobacterium isbiliense]